MLKLIKISKETKDSSTELRDIDLTIECGTCVVIMTDDSNRKSVLLEIAAGSVIPTSGKRIIDEEKCVPRMQKLIGFVPRNAHFKPGETALDMAITHASYFGVKTLVALTRIDYLSKVVHLENKMNNSVHRLTPSEQRRLLLLCALVHSPKLLLLDEPLKGVEINIRERICDYLKTLLAQKKVAILIATSDICQVKKITDTIAVIKNGQLVYLDPSASSVNKAHNEHVVRVNYTHTLKGLPSECTWIDDERIKITIGTDKDLGAKINELSLLGYVIIAIHSTLVPSP